MKKVNVNFRRAAALNTESFNSQAIESKCQPFNSCHRIDRNQPLF